jgi:hypothetical protein
MYDGKDGQEREIFTLTVGPYVPSEELDPSILPENYESVLKYHMDFTNCNVTTPDMPPPPQPKASMFGSLFSKKPEPIVVPLNLPPEEIREIALERTTDVVAVILNRIGINPNKILPDVFNTPDRPPVAELWQPTDSLTLYSYRNPGLNQSYNQVTLIIKKGGAVYKLSSTANNELVDDKEKFGDAEYLLQNHLNKRFSDDTIVLSQ